MNTEKDRGREQGEQEVSPLSSCSFIQREIFLIHFILFSFLTSAVEKDAAVATVKIDRNPYVHVAGLVNEL